MVSWPQQTQGNKAIFVQTCAGHITLPLYSASLLCAGKVAKYVRPESMTLTMIFASVSILTRTEWTGRTEGWCDKLIYIHKQKYRTDRSNFRLTSNLFITRRTK